MATKLLKAYPDICLYGFQHVPHMNLSIGIRECAGYQYSAFFHNGFLSQTYLINLSIQTGYLLTLVNFDHFEVFLADATLRTHPVLRHVFPDCAGLYSIIRPALCFIIYQATDNALPLFHANTPEFDPIRAQMILDHPAGSKVRASPANISKRTSLMLKSVFSRYSGNNPFPHCV